MNHDEIIDDKRRNLKYLSFKNIKSLLTISVTDSELGPSSRQNRLRRSSIRGAAKSSLDATTGTDYPLEIKANYFDSKGSCTISPDKLVVTWAPWKSDGEMPLILNGAKAVCRPTHPGAYAFNATVEYAPMQSWSGMLPPLPVITHEQNAIRYLTQSLDVASGFDPKTMHEIPSGGAGIV